MLRHFYNRTPLPSSLSFCIRHTLTKYLMFPLFLCSLNSLLTACSSNVRFDDSEYRAVGLTEPQNGKISNPQKAHYQAPEQLQYEADGYRDFAAGSSRRYGHSLTIRKIIQTIRIHCMAQPLTQTTQSKSEPLQFCQYQFPVTCGSHRFSLIENSSQIALVYHDRKNQRNILDQIQDNEYAQAGLWDFADQVSVSSPYPEQQLYYQFSGESAQAWVVGINNDDRTAFGTAYAEAVNATLACF